MKNEFLWKEIMKDKCCKTVLHNKSSTNSHLKSPQCPIHSVYLQFPEIQVNGFAFVYMLLFSNFFLFFFFQPKAVVLTTAALRLENLLRSCRSFGWQGCVLTENKKNIELDRVIRSLIYVVIFPASDKSVTEWTNLD